jgi:hypothetical protein
MCQEYKYSHLTLRYSLILAFVIVERKTNNFIRRAVCECSLPQKYFNRLTIRKTHSDLHVDFDRPDVISKFLSFIALALALNRPVGFSRH